MSALLPTKENREIILDKTYEKQGIVEAAKVVTLGAFGMKSAIRQSSFDAFKKIFVDMRIDLEKVLDSLAIPKVARAGHIPFYLYPHGARVSVRQ